MAPFAVLTARPDLRIYADLIHAGEQAGHAVTVLDALQAAGRVAPPAVWQGEEQLDLSSFVAVLPRVGNWRPGAVLAMLEAMQAAGVAALNRAAEIRRGRDHWLTMISLAAAGLPHPATITGSEPQCLAAAASAAVGFPCVVKQRCSRQGIGVMLCHRRDQLDGVLESFWRLGEEVVVQRFCPPGGVSRRVLVVHGGVIGATEHRAVAGEFRSNAARGADVQLVAASDEQRDLAIAAAQVMGLGFSGVDLLPDGERWLIGEVNPSPGWKHFTAASGVPVAACLIAALASCAGVA